VQNRFVLTIYRRHAADCIHLSKGRRWTKCTCPIWVQGTLGGESVRKSLDLTSWTAASELVHSWEAAGEIGVRRTEAPAIADAIATYVSASHVEPQTLRNTKDALERLFLAFCIRKGFTRLRQIQLTDLIEYKRSLSHYALSTQRAKLEQVRALFRFCQKAGWIALNPASDLDLPVPKHEDIQTFEPAEIERMFAAADRFALRGRYGDGNRRRIRAMIHTLRFTGMRISDASMLARKSLQGAALQFRTRKTGSTVWCPLPPEAVNALGASVSENSDYFFWNGRQSPQSAVKIWERTFARIFEMAEVPKDKRFLHLFRHTFATDLLTKGASLEDVATLLGNSIRVVEKHYAHLVLSRRNALEQRVRLLWAC
jgi:integrase/recombinase XerD